MYSQQNEAHKVNARDSTHKLSLLLNGLNTMIHSCVVTFEVFLTAICLYSSPYVWRGPAELSKSVCAAILPPIWRKNLDHNSSHG